MIHKSDREVLAEAISARLRITTDRVTGNPYGVALSADTAAVREAVDAVIDAGWKPPILEVRRATLPRSHPLRCASCGDRATTTIVLEGFSTPVCLRHYNVWETPDFAQLGAAL